MCTNCGWIFYAHLKVSAAALVEQDGQLLLLQRAAPPFAGSWYLPAGYVEVDEDPSAAAERETHEECGLEVRATRLLDAILYTDDPRGNGLLLVYQAQLQSVSWQKSPEIEQAGFFACEELPLPLCGAGHQVTIQRWCEGAYQQTSFTNRPAA